ncbi:hypothetical protein [Actinoalloteichus caeruleus]|uniref:Uncharacterized protein n=1 Tax=Actinoalloteichus caeruleus DSM 43889 TaxID=1120930 RepID=A0ABT1JP97_ACTCY|nr:hypothetical protein [Actinoalloteichus caeruleus]MCP2333506.1 hypothetical protein [Actinoalloteichus caeruleus DSM 43889]
MRRSSSSLHTATPGQGPAVEANPDGVPSPVEAVPDRPGRRHGLATVAGALVLFGAVVATNATTNLRPPNESDSAVPRRLVGQGALDPGQVSALLTGTPPDSTTPTPTPSDPTARERGKEDLAARSASSSEPTVNPRASTQRPRSGDELVRLFYRLLDEDPDRAVGLLAPELSNPDPGRLVSAWRAVSSVEVLSAVRRGGQRVLATVAIEHPDGGRFRAQHLVSLSGSAPWRIIQVELVSAQQG